ncbi:MAG: hypothetical protein DDT19_02874 [Syntrophomonadaceae bacterium]|nr:hypothetical protein [Bacillota bacterium]
MERMERAEFQYSIAKAKQLSAMASLQKFKNFWDNYQQGLRHYYYGKGFRDVKGHETSPEEIDYKAMGYELGCSGMPASEAYRELTCSEVYRNVLVKYIKG